jgi:hypothetical protein
MNPWEEILAHATRARVKDEHDLMEMIAGNKLERLEAENARLQKALKAIAFAEFKENYPEELWAALLMDKARAALEGKE